MFAARHILLDCFGKLEDSRTGQDLIPWMLQVSLFVFLFSYSSLLLFSFLFIVHFMDASGQSLCCLLLVLRSLLFNVHWLDASGQYPLFFFLSAFFFAVQCACSRSVSAYSSLSLFFSAIQCVTHGCSGQSLHDSFLPLIFFAVQHQDCAFLGLSAGKCAVSDFLLHELP